MTASAVLRDGRKQGWLRGTWEGNRALVLTTGVSVGLVGIAVAGLVLDPRAIGGAPAWMKPLKFGISGAVYCATLVWLLSFVRGHRRLVSLAGTVTALSLGMELVLLTVQVLRGQASHFNIGTALDGAIYSTMAFFIVAVWSMGLVVAVLLLRQRLPDSALAWSLRLGILIAVAGMALAFLMTSVPTPGQAAVLEAGQRPATFGGHSVGVADGGPGLPLVGWSTVGGDLRVAHFVGLHGLQVLPLLGVGLRRLTRLNARQQLGLVWTAGLGYMGLLAVLTWQALRGQSVVAPDGLTLAVLGGLALAVGVGAVVVVSWKE